MGSVAENYDIWRPAPETFELIADHSDRSFPSGAIRGHQTALVLFAAAWYGRQDAYYVARAGLTATCVDIRSQNFADMSRLYPDGWEFVQADVYEFVRDTTDQWDVVTVDCPSGHFQKCADMVDDLCKLARRVVVLGSGVETTVVAPRGWVIASVNRRSMMYGGVYWTVLVKA